MPSVNKPLPESVLTQTCVAIGLHLATFRTSFKLHSGYVKFDWSKNELNNWNRYYQFIDIKWYITSYSSAFSWLHLLKKIKSYFPLAIQALTTPLARLPGIARNDHRATVFVGRSCPPNLYFENSGNKRFPASKSCLQHAIGALDFES